jgi:formate--tetrahydrofolate ligase
MGGEGAVELAEAVVSACEQEHHFKFLYELDIPLRKKVELIAKEIYGADGVTYSDEAKAKAQRFEQNDDYKNFGVCMVKTHLSLSHDPNLKGRPRGWQLPVRDFMVYNGAGLIVPVAGAIKLMPGTCSDPAFRRIDVDLNTGKVTGII